MQRKGQADTGVAFYRGITGPIPAIAGGSPLARLLQELNAVDSDILRVRGWLALGGLRALANRRAFDNAHIHILLSQVGTSGYDGQVDAARIIRGACQR